MWKVISSFILFLNINRLFIGIDSSGFKTTNASQYYTYKAKIPKKLWDELFTLVGDAVPIHPDYPANKDELGRRAFARVLAKRLVQIRDNNIRMDHHEAFLIHIHGTWGSDKSSMLRFMREELEIKDPKWVVVDFNAWQHQRTGPPWWSLMRAVFNGGVDMLWRENFRSRCIELVVMEYLWRFWAKRSDSFLLLALFFGFIFIGILFGFFDVKSITTSTNSAKQFFDLLHSSVGAAIALVVSLLTGITALSRSLVPGSERAAREFVELTNDPTNRITRHFKNLVNQINQPVAIFIDDLDRCNDTYTVEFLEGLQNLFREAHVSYVIAADRRWIYTSYEKAYSPFTVALKEPGFPFGQLFLDKIFQISISMPRLSAPIQKRYWENLLKNDTSSTEEDLTEAREGSTAEVKEAPHRVRDFKRS